MKPTSDSIMKRPLLAISRTFVVFMLVATVLSSPVSAQDRRFTVKVAVRGDESIKGAVLSYLNRELRSLRDVDLAETNPEWQIVVLATELKADGRKTGTVILSTMILKHFNNSIISDYLSKEGKEAGLTITTDLYNHPDLLSNAGPIGTLQRICGEIIADFDGKRLEDIRRNDRRIKERQRAPAK
jgi:hypothetical protein